MYAQVSIHTYKSLFSQLRELISNEMPSTLDLGFYCHYPTKEGLWRHGCFEDWDRKYSR